MNFKTLYAVNLGRPESEIADSMLENASIDHHQYSRSEPCKLLWNLPLCAFVVVYPIWVMIGTRSWYVGLNSLVEIEPARNRIC
jgi:hypothetical protein